jgi:hypothetical protein
MVEEQTTNHHNTLTVGVAAEGSLTLPQGKGIRQRNKTLVNKQSKKTTPKQYKWTAELI